jgi:hypothetical protein
MLIYVHGCGGAPKERTLLFESGFEGGVYLDSDIRTDWEDYRFIRGEDDRSGYRWPIDILGCSDSALHFVADDNGTALVADIRSTTGHDGKPTQALYMAESHREPDKYTQLTYEILDLKHGDQDLYIRYRMKIDSHMKGQPNAWRALFEYKTTDYKDPGENGTGFRLIAYVYTDKNGTPSWHLQGDKDPEHPLWECDSLAPTPECNNLNTPVVFDEWFTTEYVWHWSNGDDGFVQWKINGKIVGEHHGPTTRYHNPIDFILLFQLYGDVTPKSQYIDDLIIAKPNFQ